MLVLPDFAQLVLSSFAPVFYHPTYQRFLSSCSSPPSSLPAAAPSPTSCAPPPTWPPAIPPAITASSPSWCWSTLQLARILTRFILDHWAPDPPIPLAGDDTVDEHRVREGLWQGLSSRPGALDRFLHRLPLGAQMGRPGYPGEIPLRRAGLPWPVLVALYRNPEKDPKAKAPAAKARNKKAKDKTKLKAKERARRKAGARAQAKAPAMGAKTKAVASRRRHKTPSGTDAATAGGADPLVPRPSIRLRRRRRVRDTRPGPLRGAASPASPSWSACSTPPRRCTTRRRWLSARRTAAPARRGTAAPEAVVAATDRRTELEVSWYGGGRRQVEVVSGTGCWHKSGEGLVEVLWVFVHDLTGTHRDSYFFSTDPTMAVARVIETYTGRWSIETTFQEMRAYLGLETTRGRTRITVLRSAPCLFGLFSVVVLLYAELPVGTTAEGAVSYRGKAEVTFSDAISAVRRRLWLEGVL